MNRYKHEINMRREKLAFLMDKIYFISKHQKDVYNTLAETGMIPGGDSNETEVIKGLNKVIEYNGDKIVNTIFKKEVPPSEPFAGED